MRGVQSQPIGRPPSKQSWRAWCRGVADDPELRKLAVKAVKSQLNKGNPENYLKFSEHGYGRPAPQMTETPFLLNFNIANFSFFNS